MNKRTTNANSLIEANKLHKTAIEHSKKVIQYFQFRKLNNKLLNKLQLVPVVTQLEYR